MVTRSGTRMKAAYEHLRQFALSFPEAHEEFPWGECAVKVRGKTFLFMSIDESGLRLSMKLPASREFALDYPFTKPTRYGLGKTGWVTSSFAPGDEPPLDVLRAWIGESFRAIAPKKLAALRSDAAERRRAD
jgi:predicted DNA-binding protein (MmcQ/YjbR family)